jgi:predicted ATPase
MLTAYRCRRVGDAMRAYETLRARLHEEYGVEPGQETRGLARSISRRDPTLDAPWPEWIPAPTSRFVGRRRELHQLGEQLLRTRLLTITGPGGAGKTRLSLEIGREAVHDHPDGVRFVDLSSAPAGSSVASTIAGVLGDREQPGIELLDTLATELQRSRLLLVLDNCEHLVEECAKVCRYLLERCPGLRILATSREPLGIDGERVWPLAGLALPVPGDVSEVAARSEAVRLFADRAQAAAPMFVLDQSSLPTVSELCRRLDGLPLAIELAAAQLRTQSLDEVASRLGQRLDLQDARSRTLPERHRTMRAAIDWSHRLLSPREQATFRRLAVFKGGFSRDAVERVAADPAGFAPNDATEVFEALTQLVDRSLVVAEASIDNGSVGTRYRMVETIAAYAGERLTESREELATRVRHAAWVTDLAEATEREWATDKGATLVLTAEHDNVRVALEWCLGDGQDPQRALQIGSSVWWFWWVRGLMEEGRELLDRALAASSPEPSRQRGSALRAAASLARSSGDYASAYRLGEECLRVNRAIGLERGIGFALNSLAITLQARNEIEASLELLAEARARYAEAGDDRGQASAINNMGNSLRAAGRVAEATEALQDALGRFRKLSDRRGEAAVLTNLAICARRSGDVQRSRELALHALTLYTELGLAEGQTDIFDCLAWCELADGRALSALRLLAAADQVRRRLGSPRFSPDEIADYEDALARARKLVGSRAPALERAAEEVTLDDLVAEILHDAATAPTTLNAAG